MQIARGEVNIRKATVDDVPRIGSLPDQLGYPTNRKALRDQLIFLLNHPDHLLVVGEFEEVEAVMSIHFVPQIALKGDFAIISYLCVDEIVRSNGIGEKLEAYCTNMAIDRNCDRIQVHCNIKRVDAHRFYERQGYKESRKYFSKKL